MTDSEFDVVLSRIDAYFGTNLNTKFKDENIRNTWKFDLMRCQFELCIQVINKLHGLSITEKNFKPTLGRFMFEYKVIERSTTTAGAIKKTDDCGLCIRGWRNLLVAGDTPFCMLPVSTGSAIAKKLPKSADGIYANYDIIRQPCASCEAGASVNTLYFKYSNPQIEEINKHCFRDIQDLVNYFTSKWAIPKLDKFKTQDILTKTGAAPSGSGI